MSNTSPANMAALRYLMKTYLLEWLPLILVLIVAIVLIGITYRACSMEEAWTSEYMELKDMYRGYPELRPMISEALKDDYLTKWEYKDIRDKMWDIQAAGRKEAALYDLQEFKKSIKVEPEAPEPEYPPEVTPQETDGPQILKAQ